MRPARRHPCHAPPWSPVHPPPRAQRGQTGPRRPDKAVAHRRTTILPRPHRRAPTRRAPTRARLLPPSHRMGRAPRHPPASRRAHRPRALRRGRCRRWRGAVRVRRSPARKAAAAAREQAPPRSPSGRRRRLSARRPLRPPPEPSCGVAVSVWPCEPPRPGEHPPGGPRRPRRPRAPRQERSRSRIAAWDPRPWLWRACRSPSG